MKKLGIVLTALVVATVAACSSTTSPTPSGTSGATSGGTSGTTGDAAAAANTITVGGTSNAFSPSTLSVKVGDTVTWTWAGGAHTVTSGAACKTDGMFGTDGIQSAVGSTFTHTFATAGTFEYFCEPHCASAGMKGTIVVK
jgi:plastocyanin